MAYDLIVIGTGPGGYVCAIRAAQLGLRTAVVEKRATYGGTCLNIGCIPSKALLHASELFEEAGHTFGKMGIDVSTPKLDLKAMMAFKDQGVEGNVKGVDFLFRKNKVDAYYGSGRITAPGKVWSLAATQWTYTGIEGLGSTILSGLDLIDRQPDRLLPAHGEPIDEPEPAIRLLNGRLQQLIDMRTPEWQLATKAPGAAGDCS